MAGETCTHCGGEALEPGFVEETGSAAKGYVRWTEGPLETGLFGGAKRFGRPRRKITAYRCTRCFHLELFARDHV